MVCGFDRNEVFIYSLPSLTCRRCFVLLFVQNKTFPFVFLTYTRSRRTLPPIIFVSEQAVEEISTVVGQGDNPPIICGLARALTKDIDVSQPPHRNVDSTNVGIDINIGFD